jgi:hypothetical protein
VTDQFAYDGAYARDLDAMVAHGAIAVTVYLTGNYAVPKSWVAQIHARGLGVVPNYEEAANELVYCGRTGGQSVGLRAMGAAIADRIPADNTVAILFSVDVNVQPFQFPLVGTAFDGINDVIKGRYLTDAYGEGALIDYLIDTGRIQPGVKAWLSGSSSFPGFNPASPHIGLVQLIGSPVASTDQDKFTDPAGLHAWWPPNSPYLGGDLPMTAPQIAAIAKAVAAELQPQLDAMQQQITAGSDAQHPNNLANLRGHILNSEASASSAAATSGQTVVRLAEVANAVDAHAAEIKAVLASAPAAGVPATPASSGGSVDLVAIGAKLDGLPAAIAAAVRAEIASQPLTITGAAS